MSILRLAAMLSLDGTRFKAGLKEASALSQQWGRDLSSSLKGELAAVFGAAAFVAYTKNAIASTVALKDQAEQSRMTTDEVQRLTAAAANAGLEWTQIAQAELQFNQRRREAVESNKELRETFAKYGMTLDDLQNPQLRFIDFMGRASKAMDAMNETEKARAATEMFDMLGKVGPKMGEVVTGMRAVSKERIVSPEAIKELDRLSKALERKNRSVKGFLAENAAMFSKNPWLLIGGPYTAYKMWLEKKPGQDGGTGDGAPGSDSPSRRSMIAAHLFDKTIEKTQAEKEAKEIAKDRLQLEEAIFKVRLQQANAVEDQQLREARLRTQMDAIDFIEGAGFDASKERASAVNMLGDILSQKGPRPGVSEMTQIGAWTGRNFQNASESPTVQAAKALLIPAQATQKAVESIDRKVKPGKEIRAQI